MLVLLVVLAVVGGVLANPEKPSPPPEKLILCPQNETWINCKVGYCEPQYCRDQKVVLACPQVADPCPGGCICKDGYLRDDNGVCVPTGQCPISKSCPDPNAERKKCASAETCQPTCAVPNARICPRICIIDGCECKPGYVLSARGGKCIQIEECPLNNATCNGDPNAVIRSRPRPCPSTCANPNGAQPCNRAGLTVGCECKPGYIRSEDGGKCILPTECPGGNPCGANATFAWCSVDCPTDYCPVDDSRAIIACDPAYPCPSGCICNLNYRKKSYDNDTCILSTKCPPINCTRPNEIFASCPTCLRENCADAKAQLSTCKLDPRPNCQPQCICKKGHYRNELEICVPANQCPTNQPCNDANAERVECASQCQSTCANPNPGPCVLSCKLNECVCKKGFILAVKDGPCIPVDQCPKDAPCNGDSNAVIKANPIPCPSTCSSPNAQPWCKKYAPEVGCECKPGYLKTTGDFDGKCIKPDKCPGGNPCGVNSTFVECSVNCPTGNCPVTDTRAIIACSMPYPCPSGCACRSNYRRKSNENNKCILASDCPPVNCTRPNEVWSPCPANLREYCADIDNQPKPYNKTTVYCQPQCVCKRGYFRNDNDICIPAKQCPNNKQCSDPNAERVECAPAPQCRSTCAVPNPGPCILSCAVNECVCKKGFVLSEKGGKCVPVNQCPAKNSCNGDPNAIIKECPLPCPATCDAPNPVPCKKLCKPIGCQCREGFILSEINGQCIRPEKCKGGNPCGRNETYVPCKVNCPSDYCPINNSPNRVICDPPSPCLPGCVCKINYRRTSVKDPRCMYASECPPVKCDKNEEWSGCPSDCLAEDCNNVGDPPSTCNTLLLNCQPKCICKKGYYRDSNRVCIPAKQCPKKIQCKENEVYNPCRISCPPQTCASIYSDYDCRNATKCEPGCDCISEYLRNGTEKDLCIPSEQCPGPQPVCGSNEHYEINRSKCDLTCKNKGREALIGPCQETTGCFCDDGFYRNTNGICVPKEQCPKPITCPANEVLSECYNPCHTTCKTRIRGDGRACSLACTATGCLCVSGYLRHDNGTCVPVSQCSPPKCNANETYSSCGTACPETCLNRGDTCTSCTKQCVEDCFCSKGYVRADDGSCIKPDDCPPRTCSDPNETFNECASNCPPGDGCSNLWSKFNCTGVVRCCKPECRCNPGYLRKNGKCVPSKLCLSSTTVDIDTTVQVEDKTTA